LIYSKNFTILVIVVYYLFIFICYFIASGNMFVVRSIQHLWSF